MSSKQTFDQYGFALLQGEDTEAEDHRSHQYKDCNMRDNRLDNNWKAVFSSCNFDSDSKSFAKLHKLMKKGVPRNVRPALWKNLLQSDELKNSSTFCYKAHISAIREQLVDLGFSEYSGKAALCALQDIDAIENEDSVKHGHIDVQSIRQIMLDIDRTYPSHEMFMGRSVLAKEGRAKLFRVLAAYVRYNPAVGYCQGMSFIVGMLLMQMSEEETFWCCAALFERHKYLAGYFETSLGRIKCHVAVFEKLLRERHPDLDKRFIELGLHPLMYVTPWFMGLYTSLPCWDSILAIWDRIVLEGVSAIFSIALSLIEVSYESLISCQDLTSLLPQLLHVPATVCQYDTLVPVVWRTTVEKWEIDSLISVVVEEEQKQQTSDEITAQRKRPHSSTNSDNHHKAKRRKTTETSLGASVFDRFVNMLTPRFTNWSIGPSSSSVQHAKTRRSPRLANRVRFQKIPTPPSNDKGSYISPLVQFEETPRHYNTRGQKKFKARDLNTPSNRQFVYRSAKVQHSFKTFHTPTPLRINQQSKSALHKVTDSSNSAFSSPEIELTPLNIPAPVS